MAHVATDKLKKGVIGSAIYGSHAEDRRFIKLVQKRPVLYARSTLPVASHLANSRKQWKEVADTMGWSVADARRKWSHIRNSYSRHLRNELSGALTGRGRAVSRWYLADDLHFLKEHMATDVPQQSYNTIPSVVPELKDLKPENHWQLTRGNSSRSPTASPPKPGSTEHIANSPPHHGDHLFPGTVLNSYTYSPMQLEDSSQSFTSEETTMTYFQFFRGLHGEYSELSSQRQRQFRRGCLSLLHQLLDEQEAGGDAALNLTADGDTIDVKPTIIVHKHSP